MTPDLIKIITAMEEKEDKLEEKGKEMGKSVDEEWAETLGLEIKSGQQTPPPVIPPVPQGSAPVPPPVEPPRVPEWREPMPPTYMLWAILSTLCCCIIPGVVAIYFSAMVSSRYYQRDYEGARRASRKAEIWIIASIVLGVVSAALYFPFALLGL